MQKASSLANKTTVKAATPTGFQPTAIPEGTPEPEITAINVKDGKVEVKVKNTVSYIQYALKSGDDPSSVKTAVGNPQAGQENEVVFTAPVSSNARFFKVGRREISVE